MIEETDMIEKNLGNIERLVRLAFGLGLTVFVLLQPHINALEIFVAVIALFLILNGVFSRCFFWWALGLNTFKPHPSECRYN